MRLLSAVPVLLAAPAMAQDDPADVVGPMLERAEDAYRLKEDEPQRPADCPEPEDGEILVCAPVEGDPDRFRVPSRLKRGDDSHLSWTGQAPDVSGPGIFKGPATVGGLCFIPPCPKDPVYYIDVTALPEAPHGSDADRIARGLAPRGSRYDDGEAALVAERDGTVPDSAEPGSPASPDEEPAPAPEG